MTTEVRLLVNGNIEAGTGSEYSQYLYSVKTNPILNQPGSFDIVLQGVSDTTDLAVGNRIELFWAPVISSFLGPSTRFYAGIIKTVEEITANQIEITGVGAGWGALYDRTAPGRYEWGTASRNPTGDPPALAHNYLSELVTALTSVGTTAQIVEAGTVTNGTRVVSFFDTQYEKRHLAFLRLAQLYTVPHALPAADTMDVWFTYNAATGLDIINLSRQGHDSVATFYISGSNKNAKLGSNVLDTANQFTQVNVIGAGDGYTQFKGQYPVGSFSPASPQKEMVVPRPDLKSNDDCATVAYATWQDVSQPVRRLRFSPSDPASNLLALHIGDTVTISNPAGLSHIANLPSSLTVRITELDFTQDFSANTFELVVQVCNIMQRPGDTASQTNYIASQGFSSGQLECNLNLLTDPATGFRNAAGYFLAPGGKNILAQRLWLAMSGATPAASFVEGDPALYYPLTLGVSPGWGGQDPTDLTFRGHILFSTGHTSNPPTPDEGALYYNSSAKTMNYYDGTAWQIVTTTASSGFWLRWPTGFVYPANNGDSVYPSQPTAGSIGGPLSYERWNVIYSNGIDVKGNSITQAVYPRSGSTYDLGTDAARYNNIYLDGIIRAGGEAYLGGLNVNNAFEVSGGSITMSLVPFYDFFENMYIYGNFYVMGGYTKSFRIEHPFDKNKWLQHSCIEAPEPMTIYKGRGKIVNGECRVDLPKWFHPLNGDGEDCEYSLMPISKPMMLFISEPLHDEQGYFIVGADDRFGHPIVSGEFSWVVYTSRKDMDFDPEPDMTEKEKTRHGEYVRGKREREAKESGAEIPDNKNG